MNTPTHALNMTLTHTHTHTHTHRGRGRGRERLCTCLRISLLCKNTYLPSFLSDLGGHFFLCHSSLSTANRASTQQLSGHMNTDQNSAYVEEQANTSWGPLIRYKNEWPSLAWGSPAAPCNAATHTMASATLPPAVPPEKLFCLSSIWTWPPCIWGWWPPPPPSFSAPHRFSSQNLLLKTLLLLLLHHHLLSPSFPIPCPFFTHRYPLSLPLPAKESSHLLLREKKVCVLVGLTQSLQGELEKPKRKKHQG